MGLQRRGPGWLVDLTGWKQGPTSSGTDPAEGGRCWDILERLLSKSQTDLVFSRHCVTSGKSLSLSQPQSSHLRNGGSICPSPQPPRAWQIVKYDTHAGCLPFSGLGFLCFMPLFGVLNRMELGIMLVCQGCCDKRHRLVGVGEGRGA